MKRLRAARTFVDSTGTISDGQIFEASEELATRLRERGDAVLPHERLPWSGLRWPHCTVVIIASGPSLTVKDCALVEEWRAWNLSRRRVIVVNSSCVLAKFSDVLYAGDLRWWEEYYKQTREWFAGQLWTEDLEALASCDRLHYIASERYDGLNLRRGKINQGGNSGFQALGLAFQSGADRILLVGYDMQDRVIAPDDPPQPVDNLGHWHPDHPGRLHSFPNYASWIAAFDKAAPDFVAAGVEVVNCSRATALTCFKRMTLEDALKEKGESISASPLSPAMPCPTAPCQTFPCPAATSPCRA